MRSISFTKKLQIQLLHFFAFGICILNTAYAESIRSPFFQENHPFFLIQNEGSSSQIDDQYRIGDEWGKKPVSSTDLSQSEVLRRSASATAMLRGATSFYLGTFQGQYLIATNHHVCPSAFECLDQEIQFPILGVKAKVKSLLGSWSKIDLALLTISFNSLSDYQKISPFGRNFSFHSKIYSEQPLLTVGFGWAFNKKRELVANQDSDCKVFSNENDFRLMSDPDEFNPGDYQAWSFANGCDVSHGDSGSAMVDRQTGEVIGIIWTGKIPKSAKVQNSQYLDQLLHSQSNEIWTELSYSVPASKMREILTDEIEKGHLNPTSAAIIKEIIQ